MDARFSAPVQTGPGVHSASCIVGTGSFPGIKSGQGVTLIPHPPLGPWSRKNRAIPLLILWAVRPVQSLSASTRVHFNFTYFYVQFKTSSSDDVKFLLIELFCTTFKYVRINVSMKLRQVPFGLSPFIHSFISIQP